MWEKLRGFEGVRGSMYRVDRSKEYVIVRGGKERVRSEGRKGKRCEVRQV